jgi:hypothetical protein
VLPELLPLEPLELLPPELVELLLLEAPELLVPLLPPLLLALFPLAPLLPLPPLPLLPPSTLPSAPPTLVSLPPHPAASPHPATPSAHTTQRVPGFQVLLMLSPLDEVYRARSLATRSGSSIPFTRAAIRSTTSTCAPFGKESTSASATTASRAPARWSRRAAPLTVWPK